MSNFAIHGHRLPYAQSYAQAHDVWENAVDLGNGSWRGLVNKREREKAVRKDSTGAISFKYHNTTLVEWFPSMLVVTLHDSVSSGIFVGRFTPPGVYYKNHLHKKYLCVNGRLYMPKGDRIRMYVRGSDIEVLPEDCKTFHTYVLNRKRAAEIKALLQPFIDWRNVICKMKGNHQYSDWQLEGSTQDLMALQDVVNSGQVVNADLMERPLFHSPKLLNHAYVLGRAVAKKDAPPGEPESNSVYRGLRSWDYV